MRLKEDLYAYLWQNSYDNNCNTYVIDEEVIILIDPGHTRHLGQVLKQMEEDGLSPEAIDFILLTHSHPDHFEGLEAFLGQPVKIAMNQEEERYLLENGKFLFEMMGRPLPKFRIDFYLKEGELHLKKRTFHIYQTPGHSPGSLSIYWPERKALFTGDLIFQGGIGRTDFIEGNAKLLMENIERLAGLDTEILLPGHGEILMGRETILQNFEFIRQNFYPYL